MEAQNPSQHPEKACLIAGLSSNVQHEILNIGNYVFRPLSFILAFFAFVFNTLVIIAVARTKSPQYPSMMCSLAVTDIIFPLYSLYRYIEVFTHEHMCPTSHAHPGLYFAVSGLCTLGTLGNLAVLSRDRYLSVRRPVWYRNHMKISRAFKTLTLAYQCGICSFNVLFKPFEQSLHTYGTSFPSSSFPFLFICHHVLLS